MTGYNRESNKAPTYDNVTDDQGQVIDLERFMHEVQSPLEAHALTVDLVARIHALKRGDGGWNGGRAK